MPSWRLVTGSCTGNTQDQNTTRYAQPDSYFSLYATEEVQVRARDTYTLKNLFVRVIQNNLTGATTVRSRKNGANGNMSISIGAGATGAFEDLVNSDALISGDLFTYQSVTGGGAGGATITYTIMASVLQTAANITPIIAAYSGISLNFGVTTYCPFCGDQYYNTTEVRSRYIFRVAATLSNLIAYVFFNNLNGATTFRTRKNGANGNMSITVGAGATGWFEDAVLTDAIVDGDSVNEQVITGGGSGSIIIVNDQVKSTSTGRQTAAASPDVLTIPFGVTRYLMLEANCQDVTATETYTQLTMRIAATGKNFLVRVGTNSVNGNSTFRTRKNGANGNMSVTVGAGATGTFEDLVNSDSLVAADSYNYQIITGGGSGSMQLNIIGFELQQPTGGGVMSWNIAPRAMLAMR